MKDKLYSCPHSPPSNGEENTKNTVVNKTENEGSKPYLNTHNSHQIGGSRRHSFTNRIMHAELLFHWNGLSMDRYNGTIDLDKHIDSYVT